MQHSTAEEEEEEVIKLLLYQDRYWITTRVNWKCHCNVVVYRVDVGKTAGIGEESRSVSFSRVWEWSRQCGGLG